MKIEYVYYKHWRYFDNTLNKCSVMNQPDIPCRYTRGQTKWQPTCMGGLTECHLVLENEIEIVGIAECSLKDNFVYALGRTIAYGRAMKQYQDSLTAVTALRT